MMGTTNGTVDRKDGSIQVVDESVRLQIESLQADMQQNLQNIRDSVAKAEALVTAKNALLAQLPANLPFAPVGMRIEPQVYRADAELTFSVASREQALTLLEALPGVAVVMVKGGTTTFLPEARFDNSNPAIKPPTLVSPLVYRVSHYLGKLREEYFWWTLLGEALVHIRAVNDSTTNAKVASRHRRGYEKNLQLVWDYQGLPKGTLTYWYGASSSQAAPVTVHLSRDATIREAYAHVMPAVYTAVTTDCSC